MNIDCNPSPRLGLSRPQWRLAWVLQVFLILLYALGPFVFALALKGKKVLQVLVAGIRRAVKRLAGVFKGLKYEYPKRIHCGFSRRSRGLFPIVSPIVLVYATLLLSHPAFAQFSPQEGPKLLATGGEHTSGLYRVISTNGNAPMVGGIGTSSFNGATWIYADSAPTVVQAPIRTQPSNQAVTADTSVAPVVAPAVGFAISPPVSDLREQPRAAASAQTDGTITTVPLGRLPRNQTPALAAMMENNVENNAIQSTAPSLIPAPSRSFDGLSSQDNANAFAGGRVYPPDPIGDVGPNHYVQNTNLLVRVYSKTGTTLSEPFKMSSLFAPLGGICSTNDNGDGTVLYDPLADRWLLSQFAFTSQYSPPFHQCIAISTTPDPTGAYFLYDFVMPGSNFNDYPKFGVWSDGYYMSDNQFQGNQFTGAGVFAFDRAKMLAGNPAASFIYFDLGTNYGGMLPADIDGTLAPPAGTPNYFGMFQATLFGDPSDAMRIFSFHADFANPGASTFTERPESPIAVAAFDPRTPNTANVIEQPAPAITKMYLDALQDRLMHRLAYRNFGGTRESLVVTHTVNVGPDPSTTAGHQAAIRYYEFRRGLPGGSFTVPEQATFAPDAENRWMGSAAMDSQGNIAVGYSVSSKSTFPSIRYAGRLASDPPNGLFQGEAVLAVGSGVQRGTAGRWGDYSALSVDPSDDCTFWYTTEYYSAASQASSEVGWLTRIGSFKFPNCGAPTSQGMVTGTITDPVAGATLSNAVVTFSPGGYAAARGANGTYSATVPTGTYTLTASATHRASASVSGVVVTNGGTTTVNFSLPFPASTGLITGHVRNGRTNAPFAKAVVTASPGGSSSTTDEDGFYELYLSAGTYTVTASSADFVDSSATGVVVADQGITTRDFSLQPSVHLLAQLGEPSRSNVKLADLDGDGKSEVIVTTVDPTFFGGGRIHVLSSSGTELPGWPVTPIGRPLLNTVAVGDIDGDGHPEIVVETFGNAAPDGRSPQEVWAFTTTGVLKPGFPVAVGAGSYTGLFTNGQTPSLALADLDGDGVPEIIAIDMGFDDPQGRAAVVAIKGDGSLLFSTTLPLSVPPVQFFSDEYPHYSVPMIGHLTGDALPEIIVGVHANGVQTDPASPYTSFFALTATGAFLPGWPVRVAGGIPGCSCGIIETGVLGDLNGDGRDEFIVTAPKVGSTPMRLYVFDGSGQVMSGFPKDLHPSFNNDPSYPALADVDHDGFLDIVTLSGGDLFGTDNNYYLMAHDRFGRLVAQTAWPAINDNLFSQGINWLRLALAEDATGQVCAVFPFPEFPPNQANLQLQARCLNGAVVPGFPMVLPSLSDLPFSQDATSVSLARDTGSTQVYSVLIDQSGNVRRWDIFNSTKPIPWGQFQHDAASSGLARISQTLSVTRAGAGTGSVWSSLSGIACGATCSADFNSGEVVALTASAVGGSTFTGWSGDCAGLGVCKVTMSAARAVTATFSIQQFTLTVTKAGTGSGTVTSAPAGINCGATCSASYSIGTSVTLSATAAAGSTFSGWGGACTGAGSCVVSMSSAKSVTATFNVATPAVALSPTSLTFADQHIGTTSTPQSATLSNTGSAPLAISSIVTTGDFAVSNNCGSSLAASGSCNLGVTFTPTTVAGRIGVARVTSNASGSPHIVTLSGVGVASNAPICTLTATPASIPKNGTSTLTASCNPVATSYSWTGGNCGGTTASSCVEKPGVTTAYSVTGTNAYGSSTASAQITVKPFDMTPILMLLLD